jgi:hypothetical protein
VAMQMVKNEILGNVPEDVEAKLEKVFNSMV